MLSGVFIFFKMRRAASWEHLSERQVVTKVSWIGTCISPFNINLQIDRIYPVRKIIRYIGTVFQSFLIPVMDPIQ